MKKIFTLTFMILAMPFGACTAKTPSDSQSQAPVISVFSDSSSKSTDTKTPSTTEKSPTVTPPVTTPAPQTATPEPSVSGAADSPKEVIKQYTAELQNVYDGSKNLKDKKRDKEIVSHVRKFFDFNGLAKLSLSDHWNKLPTKKQQEFSILFTQLIEQSYLKKSRNLVTNYKLSYGNEKIDGNNATVECSIFMQDADLEIVYSLHKVNGNWMIYNIVFDQVDLAKNYETQFNKIFAKSNIDGLTSMMRKQLKNSNSEINNAL